MAKPPGGKTVVTRRRAGPCKEGGGLSFARACMTSQCITSWGLSSNDITSLHVSDHLAYAEHVERPARRAGLSASINNNDGIEAKCANLSMGIL